MLPLWHQPKHAVLFRLCGSLHLAATGFWPLPCWASAASQAQAWPSDPGRGPHPQGSAASAYPEGATKAQLRDHCCAPLAHLLAQSCLRSAAAAHQRVKEGPGAASAPPVGSTALQAHCRRAAHLRPCCAACGCWRGASSAWGASCLCGAASCPQPAPACGLRHPSHTALRRACSTAPAMRHTSAAPFS